MSVTQPSTFLFWDTNLANILTPPAAYLENGYIPGQAYPCEYDNYVIWLLDQWIQFLQQQVSSNGGQTTVTTSQTLTTTYVSWFFNPSGGNLIATLPNSIGVPGQLWRVKNVSFGGSKTVTVVLNLNTDKLEGTLNGTAVLNPGEILIVQSDGAGNYYQMTP